MRYFSLIFLVLSSASASAGPPSFWESYASSRGEGLRALQEAKTHYLEQRFALAFEQSLIAREKAPSEESEYIFLFSYYELALRTANDFEMAQMCAFAAPAMRALRVGSKRLRYDTSLSFAIGLCEGINGNLIAARDEYLFFLTLYDPINHPLAYINLGDILMASLDLEGAKKAYRRAVELIPFQPYVLFALSVALWRSHDEKEAVIYLQRALQDDPSLDSLQDAIYVPAEERYYFLAFAYAGLGETGLAHQLLGDYLSEAPEGPYRERAKEAFYKIEDFSRALGATP